MDRRGFLKIAFGVAASVAAATAAQAALLAPRPLSDLSPDNAPTPQHAVAGNADVEGARVEQVRWHGRHRGWYHHPRWGWHRPRWRRRRRYWGWHPHRRWRVYRRRHWRRRYW